jgi:hypothetical protein
LKRYLIGFLFMCVTYVYGSTHYYGFFQHLTNLKERIINGYIHYENKKSFDSIAYWVSVTLMENISMMRSHILDKQWYEHLKEEGVLTGAYLREGSEILAIGPSFLPRFETTSSFFIDEEHSIHFVHIDSSARGFSEFIFLPASIEPMRSHLERQPDWIVLYDKEEDTYSTVWSRNNSSIENSVLRALSEGMHERSSLFGNVHFVKQLEMGNAHIFLISQFPFKIGQKLFVLIGLIVIILTTILLLYSHIRFIASRKNTLPRLRAPSVNNIPETTVVMEIDNVLARFNKQPEVKTRYSAETGGPARVAVEFKSDDNLESDGIRIKKN